MTNPFEVIESRLATLENMLLQVRDRLQSHVPDSHSGRQVFNLEQFCAYTGFKARSVYKLTSKGLVPHSKRGKRLYFDKAQVDAWLLEHQTGGSTATEQKADSYLMARRRRRA